MADAYALRLNEIEANPEGEDSGNEWVELYSEDNVNLDGYSLDHNSSGGPVNLSGTFQGFFVITFPSQWLRNTNEVVYLKLNGEVVDTAGPFSDNKNNENTYSSCNGVWVFASSTQNAENSCSSGSGGSGGTQTQTGNSNNNNQNSNNSNLNPNNINEEEDNNIVVNDESNLSNKNNIVLTSYEGNQKPKKIVLNGKSDDGEDNAGEVTRTYKTRVGVIYFFIGLCVLLVVLIALRKL